MEAGRGNWWASSGKLRMAEVPLMVRAATSWARAAISGVEKVPSQIRLFFRGSRISETHFPHALIRTPRKTGCLLLLLFSLGRLSRFRFDSTTGDEEDGGDKLPDDDGDGGGDEFKIVESFSICGSGEGGREEKKGFGFGFDFRERKKSGAFV